MSNTYLHKEKMKFTGSQKLSVNLANHFRRHNFEIGYLRKLRYDLRERQAKKELKEELNNNIDLVDI